MGCDHPPPQGAGHPDGVSIHAPAWGATHAAGALPQSLVRFNPRTRVGCDKVVPAENTGETVFQSTHPRGVRRDVRPGCPRGRRVSIHAPAWGATILLLRTSLVDLGFNPRTRVGCDTRTLKSRSRCRWFQSTHPRGVRRRGDRQCHSLASFQSTHPRGVRLLMHKSGQWLASVSIHAPAWGATASSRRRTARPCGFQSTHPRGVRPPELDAGAHVIFVSIHAPAWGATTPAACRAAGSRSFNPRTRVGCDRGTGAFCTGVAVFQSTHPRGVRLLLPVEIGQDISLFQSTHPRGVRLLAALDTQVGELFQSTHPRGVRRTVTDTPRLIKGFNPRTRVGCDPRHRRR